MEWVLPRFALQLVFLGRKNRGLAQSRIGADCASLTHPWTKDE